TEEFQLCGEPVVEGRPYCANHCERAYVRVSKERKDTEAA
ncbi:MAG: global cell cycle regulator GcrA-like protein, partial [Alphaproteobacteria bacterium]|nr:global cell cycle regulator GcrA-like protein [Alphaproteobacteria bacterium]